MKMKRMLLAILAGLLGLVMVVGGTAMSAEAKAKHKHKHRAVAAKVVPMQVSPVLKLIGTRDKPVYCYVNGQASAGQLVIMDVYFAADSKKVIQTVDGLQYRVIGDNNLAGEQDCYPVAPLYLIPESWTAD